MMIDIQESNLINFICFKRINNNLLSNFDVFTITYYERFYDNINSL